MLISSSILSMKDKNKENIKKLNLTDTDLIHLDIMDGIFVANKTIEYKELACLLEHVTKPYDVHLMVEDIKKYIDVYKNINPRYITFHFEATDNPIEIIDYIKKLNIKVGVSIKPDTDVEQIYSLLPYIDMVLIMSVEPGLGGQLFLTETSNKINILKQKQKEYDFLIEVDGGINNGTINSIKGANIAVVGSFITSSANYQEQIDILKNSLK